MVWLPSNTMSLPSNTMAEPTEDAAATAAIAEASTLPLTPRDQQASFDGALAGGVKNGHGVESYGSGDSFEGSFVDGMKHGLGVLRFADGSSHEGQYHKGVREGPGVFRFADGRALVGNFVADAPSGEYVLWGAVLVPLGRVGFRLVMEGVSYKLSKAEALVVCETFGQHGVPKAEPVLFAAAGPSGFAKLIAQAKEEAEAAKSRIASKAKDAAGSPLAEKWKGRVTTAIEDISPNKGWGGQPGVLYYRAPGAMWLKIAASQRQPRHKRNPSASR